MAGHDLGDLDPADSLITTVVPLDVGSVRVTGIEISYEQGGRRTDELVEVGEAVTPVR